ncbi:MAG TPA: hypothetical protein VGB99_14305, partial [Acidobacteriota bacterium]
MRRQETVLAAASGFFWLATLVAAPAVELRIDKGTDPDIAVGADGLIHVVYTIGSKVSYASYNLSNGFVRKAKVGSGSDPHIAVNSEDIPYVAWDAGSRILVSKRNANKNKFKQIAALGQQCGSCPGIRKPRLAVDLADDTVYLHFEDRKPFLVKIKNDKAGGRILLADEGDAGSVAVSAGGLAHNVMRTVPGLFYRQILPDGTMASLLRLNQGASDFCDIAYDTFDPRIAKVAGVQAGSLGDNIEFITVVQREIEIRRTGAELIRGLDHDFVGPSIAVDRFNRSFVTFSGKRRAYYFVADDRDRIGAVLPLASVAGEQGAKFTYPEISADPRGGAWAAWQDKRGGSYSIYIVPIEVPGLRQAGSAPRIAAAGVKLDTASSAAAPQLRARAYADDPDGDLSGVELLVNGEPSGTWLRDDGAAGDAIAGDRVYSLNLELPAGVDAEGLRFGLRAIDSAGRRSDDWPHLKVDRMPATAGACAAAEDVGAAVRRALAADRSAPDLIAGFGCSALSTARGGRLELLAIARPDAAIARVELDAGAALAGRAEPLAMEQPDDSLFLLSIPEVGRGLAERRERLDLTARDRAGRIVASWP